MNSITLLSFGPSQLLL